MSKSKASTKTKTRQPKSAEVDQAKIDQQVNELFAIHREDPPSAKGNWKLYAFAIGVMAIVLLIAVISLP